MIKEVQLKKNRMLVKTQQQKKKDKPNQVSVKAQLENPYVQTAPQNAWKQASPTKMGQTMDSFNSISFKNNANNTISNTNSALKSEN